MKKRLLFSSWLLFCSSALRVAAADTNGAFHSLPALQTAIESILKESKTPGAAMVIVTSNKLDWVAGLGKADVAANQPVTPDTLFRLGSVSKGIVALAALQLQEAGKLQLTDTVRQWAPDAAFVNPWEATNPVRLEHLMEHTSGFDDMRLREYALDDPAMTLDAALAYGEPLAGEPGISAGRRAEFVCRVARAAHSHETRGLLVFGARRADDGSRGRLSRLVGADWTAPVGITQLSAQNGGPHRLLAWVLKGFDCLYPAINFLPCA